jgi:DNA gyrase subunit A
MRAKAEIETDESHDRIVVTEIPYGVNKQQLIEYIAELVKEGKLEGISNVNDETGRQGVCVSCRRKTGCQRQGHPEQAL